MLVFNSQNKSRECGTIAKTKARQNTLFFAAHPWFHCGQKKYLTKRRWKVRPGDQASRRDWVRDKSKKKKNATNSKQRNSDYNNGSKKCAAKCGFIVRIFARTHQTLPHRTKYTLNALRALRANFQPQMTWLCCIVSAQKGCESMFSSCYPLDIFFYLYFCCLYFLFLLLSIVLLSYVFIYVSMLTLRFFSFWLLFCVLSLQALWALSATTCHWKRYNLC